VSRQQPTDTNRRPGDEHIKYILVIGPSTGLSAGHPLYTSVHRPYTAVHRGLRPSVHRPYTVDYVPPYTVNPYTVRTLFSPERTPTDCTPAVHQAWTTDSCPFVHRFVLLGFVGRSPVGLRRLFATRASASWQTMPSKAPPPRPQTEQR